MPLLCECEDDRKEELPKDDLWDDVDLCDDDLCEDVDLWDDDLCDDVDLCEDDLCELLAFLEGGIICRSLIYS